MLVVVQSGITGANHGLVVTPAIGALHAVVQVGTTVSFHGISVPRATTVGASDTAWQSGVTVCVDAVVITRDGVLDTA